MTPFDLLERREYAARQLESFAMISTRKDRVNISDPGYLELLGEADHLSPDVIAAIRLAVPFWWDAPMIALAVASPLPRNYTIPELPYPDVYFAFPGSVPDAWGSVVISETFGTLLLAPMAYMTATYPGFDERTFAAQLRIFLASPYVTTERRRPGSKSAQRRLSKWDTNELRFVILRTPEGSHAKRDHDATSQEWRSRWMVRGHYRNQWYASERRHQTIWVASYIKGPADKPLRVPTYRVAR